MEKEQKVSVAEMTEEEKLQVEDLLNELESHYIIPPTEDGSIIDELIRDEVGITLDLLKNGIFCLPDVIGYENVIVYAYLDGCVQYLAKEYSKPVMDLARYVIDEMVDYGFTGLDGWKEYYRESLENPEWREGNLKEYFYWVENIKWKPVLPPNVQINE